MPENLLDVTNCIMGAFLCNATAFLRLLISEFNFMVYGLFMSSFVDMSIVSQMDCQILYRIMSVIDDRAVVLESATALHDRTS